MEQTAVGYLVAGLIGTLLGATELISRYRDAPLAALTKTPGIAYAGLNGLASVLALWGIGVFGWEFGLGTESAPTGLVDAQVQYVRILVAGFGAMALFRSTLFNVRIGDQDVSVGPNSILQVLLRATDGAVDRKRGEERADEVQEAMQDLPLEKAEVDLPLLCLSLMQSLGPGEQQSLAEQIQMIVQNEDVDEPTKRLALGLKLMDVVGDEVVKKAVETLKEEADKAAKALGKAEA